MLLKFKLIKNLTWALLNDIFGHCKSILSFFFLFFFFFFFLRYMFTLPQQETNTLGIEVNY